MYWFSAKYYQNTLLFFLVLLLVICRNKELDPSIIFSPQCEDARHSLVLPTWVGAKKLVSVENCSLRQKCFLELSSH